MPPRLYDDDPLTPGKRDEFEESLISFSDSELDLLGDIRGLDVLYAGGASPLWIEGLSQRLGEEGNLTALEAEAERISEGREALRDAALAAPVRLVLGNVFEPPFGPRTFDLVYSAGLFHELDVRERPAEDALRSLISVVQPGGRVATSDFIDAVPAVQLADEEIQRELALEASGAWLYGIGSPERLVGLHESLLEDVRWRVSLPYEVRHLDELVLAEGEPEELSLLPAGAQLRLHERRNALLELVRREGYTRPATLYVEGQAGGG